MAKLTSTIVYGNLDVTGNLTINGELLSDIAFDGVNSRLDSVEAAGLATATNLIGLQNSVNTLTNNFNGYQGPLELQVASGYIQWRKAGATTWTNLIAISSLMPAITSLENQVAQLKSDLVRDLTALESNILNQLDTGITNAEIDAIIANALI